VPGIKAGAVPNPLKWGANIMKISVSMKILGIGAILPISFLVLGVILFLQNQTAERYA
jgi:hypothetical protein